MKVSGFVCVVMVLIAGASTGWGQASTSHVFPQVVDGTLDGSTYLSLLSIANFNTGSANCNLGLAGMGADRWAGSLTPTLSGYYTIMNATRGQGGFQSGFAELNCTQPVQASLTYIQIGADGHTASMATVFSAPRVGYASLPVLAGLGFRYALALVNPGTVPISVEVSLERTSGSQTTKLQVPARTRLVRFADELLTVPSAPEFDLLEVTSSSKFHVTALLYSEGKFTTLIPATTP